MLNLNAVIDAPMVTDPFPFTAVAEGVNPWALMQIGRDFPRIAASAHPDHALAEVLAGQQPDQGGGGVLQPVDDVFLHFQFSGGNP